jgi:tRNA G18 (ribose-2'-O)-methylase SpoU
VAEGRVVLEKAVRAIPDCLVSVLVAEQRLAGLSDVLSGLSPSTCVYAAGQAVMDAIVGFPIHRGILAIGRRPERSAADLLAGLPDRALVVGLVGIANHDNMGGILRNAAAFGADAVLIDDGSCDPLYRKAIRVSVGAALTTPSARAGSAEAMLNLLEAAGFEAVGLTPDGATDLREFRPPARTAVLFGAEGPGLPPAVLERVQTIGIGMSGGFDSLNVAATSAIVLHQIAAPPGPRP